MPSGTPIAIEAAAAATTSTSVCTVCFHRPWLMMKSRPRNTPMASTFDRCSHQASSAINSTTRTGGMTSSRLTMLSSSVFNPFEKPRKMLLKLSVRKVKNALPHAPIGIFQVTRKFETGSICPPISRRRPPRTNDHLVTGYGKGQPPAGRLPL